MNSHEHHHDKPQVANDHGHDHAHACCSGNSAPAIVTISEKPLAGGRLSSFRIEQMDCPTEQTLIQNKLGKLAGVQQLEVSGGVVAVESEHSHVGRSHGH